MRRLVFLILVLSTMVYLIVGSVVFHYLEDFSETQQKKSLARAHAEFIEHHPEVNQSELEQLIMTAIRTHMEGISIAAILKRNLTGNHSMDDESVVTSSKWDIASGFLFCITVISTIGYGNMVPRTWGGQLFCIFYALFGIPIFGAVLVGTGERLQIPIKKLHQCRPWVKDNPIKDQKLKSILLLSTGMSVIVFIPAWVFTITEDWSYLEGMYYSIITLTTVGFGDLVPGNHLSKKTTTVDDLRWSPWTESIFTETGQGLEEFLIPKGATATRHYFYRIVLSLWIIMGLSWIALILSEISTMMQSQMNNVANSTSHRLSNLEVLVRKKAKETRDRFSKRDFCRDMYELTRIKSFQTPSLKQETVTASEKDKTVHGQTNNVMVMSIAAASQVSEDEGDCDVSDDTNIVTCPDPGGSTNNISSSDTTQWTNINGSTTMLDEHNGHALPATDELTKVVET